MMWYWTKTNRIIKKCFSKYVWDIPNSKSAVYLTFDDGPTPIITEWTLNQLKKYDAKATFFCIGDNIKKHPDLFQKIIDDGHSIGNHTNNHLNGWITKNTMYLENIASCETEIKNALVRTPREGTKQHFAKLFRPPYGKIKITQAKRLRRLDYKIIMWDVLSADFDTSISTEKCFENATNNVVSGSIIVFHDSQKAFKNLKYALPKTLEHLQNKGFICAAID